MRGALRAQHPPSTQFTQKLTHPGLVFVAASRQPPAEVDPFVHARAASRPPTTAATVVSDAASLLDVGEGGAAFLVMVDATQQATLQWHGRLVSLEAALGRAFPLEESDSSSEEEEGGGGGGGGGGLTDD